jgi:hypothetical protein
VVQLDSHHPLGRPHYHPLQKASPVTVSDAEIVYTKECHSLLTLVIVSDKLSPAGWQTRQCHLLPR